MTLRALTSEEAVGWCRERGLGINQSGYPQFSSPRLDEVRFFLPKKPQQLPFMLLSLIDAKIDEREGIAGAEHLVWISQCGIWQEWVESTGQQQFGALRRGLGIADELAEKPATLFSGADIAGLISCALVPLVFGWDCYIIPSTAGYFSFISHDEYVAVSAKDESTASQLRYELEAWGAQVVVSG
jgi:hypothetical protein